MTYLSGIAGLSCWLPWAKVRPLEAKSPSELSSVADFVIADGASIQFDGWNYGFAIGPIPVFGWWIGAVALCTAVAIWLLPRRHILGGFDPLLGSAMPGASIAVAALVQMLLFNADANETVASAGYERSIGAGPFVAAIGWVGALVAAWASHDRRAPQRLGPA